MYTAAEKDKIINACIEKGTKVRIAAYGEEGIRQTAIADLLEKEEYIKVTQFGGSLIYWLTDKGFELKTKGGFTSIERKEILDRKQSLYSNRLFWLMIIAIAVAIGGIIYWLL